MVVTTKQMAALEKATYRLVNEADGSGSDEESSLIQSIRDEYLENFRNRIDKISAANALDRHITTVINERTSQLLLKTFSEDVDGKKIIAVQEA